ncbi:MAG TPA: vWA domain-containing protein [Xanthomonadaceae bacterium]
MIGNTRLTSILCCGLSATALSWSATVSAQVLTLNVPYRGDGLMQNAATTIEFDAASVNAGATIDIAGTLVNVPVSACGGACIVNNATPQGDDFSLTRIAGTERVRLHISFFSVFGPTLCDSTMDDPGDAIARNITLSGFTFGAGKGYRITSFMAPSDLSCSDPYARVPTNRPFITGGGLTKLGRLPLNVVLALDASPSMEWTIPGSPDIRWDRLKSSVQLFASVWDAVGAPPLPATVSSEGHADDRLGMVFFGGTSLESPLDGANFFKSRGVNVAPWSAPVTAGLNAQGFIGGTSVGAGLTNARSRLNTVATLTGDTAVVLFTDGEQNTPPCIVRQGEVTTPTVKPYPGLPGVTYTDQCTVVAAAATTQPLILNGNVLAQNVLPRGPVFTIGLGEGGMAASAVLLDEISQETSGSAAFPNNGVAMDTSFVDSLVNNLKGGTVSLLDRFHGQVPGASSSSPPSTVVIDGSVSRVSFVVSWDGIPTGVSLTIKRPDGRRALPRVASGPNHRVYTFDLPTGGPAGAWTVQVNNQNRAGTVRYQVSAYAVERQLSARVVQSRQLGAGRPIEIVAEIGWGNRMLADLPAGAVRAYIERPGENLGNLLREPVQFERGKIEHMERRLADKSPLALKLEYLIRYGKLLDRIEPRPTGDVIELKSMGDGRYAGSFDGTKVGGGYRIRVEFDWKDRRTGKWQVRRKTYAERQVQVRPSAADTEVKVDRDPRTGDVLIRLVPRDGFGNYVGPGFENSISVVTRRLRERITITDDNLSGEYTARLRGIDNLDNVKVRILFAGEVLREGTLSDLKRTTTVRDPK